MLLKLREKNFVETAMKPHENNECINNTRFLDKKSFSHSIEKSILVKMNLFPDDCVNMHLLG